MIQAAEQKAPDNRTIFSKRRYKMEKNHDMMKTASLTKIRKSSRTVLIAAILFLLMQLISRPLQLLYTVQMQKKAGASSNILDYLNAVRYGSVPVQAARAALMIASVVILIGLFVRIRNSESPFQERHGKILQIIAVLQGIFPFTENIEQIILRLFRPGERLDIESILFLFSPDRFSYWLLANAVMLFFLGWVIRYGAVLQQASDETL